MNRKLGMNKKLKEKISEALTSVLPITAIVFILSITITPLPIGTMMLFLAGALLLIVGMGFFTLGADIAMMPMGEGISAKITHSKKFFLVAVVFFVMGVIITMAEPDLQVLADQVPAVPNLILIVTVALGVGFFLVVALLRTLFRIDLRKLLIGFYVAVFALSFLAPGNFVPVAFDSGGVTTGPITVPFIMAIGLGVASIRTDAGSREESFGLVALCSIGPILAVLLLGIAFNPTGAAVEPIGLPIVATTADVAYQFAEGFPKYMREVSLALLPILALLLIFQFATRHFGKRSLIRMLVGLIYTFIGLVLFLTGVNVGFMPAGHYIGTTVAGSAYKELLIPIGMLIGYFIVAAEPAVHVLNKQVEEVSLGAIPQKYMQLSLSIGMAVSLGLAMVRVLYGISIYWFLVPGYGLALALTLFTPKIFTNIAFDSGGVASGPMTATFLLPFAMGSCEILGGNILTDAFGIVAMVAMTPLITIQILGLISHRRTQTAKTATVVPGQEDEIIIYEEEGVVSDD
ncbi:MAG: DUF1538 domain-containing protein [Peptococcaceae bacterium]|jgi:hypothetical protein|nr:DUF1538 domain-containing protein [Peptococcaceae bacterium]